MKPTIKHILKQQRQEESVVRTKKALHCQKSIQVLAFESNLSNNQFHPKSNETDRAGKRGANRFNGSAIKLPHSTSVYTRCRTTCAKYNEPEFAPCRKANQDGKPPCECALNMMASPYIYIYIYKKIGKKDTN